MVHFCMIHLDISMTIFQQIQIHINIYKTHIESHQKDLKMPYMSPFVIEHDSTQQSKSLKIRYCMTGKKVHLHYTNDIKHVYILTQFKIWVEIVANEQYRKKKIMDKYSPETHNNFTVCHLKITPFLGIQCCAMRYMQCFRQWKPYEQITYFIFHIGS